MKITFLGDISLNDDYNILFEKGDSPFSSIEERLKESDFVIGNLECISEGGQGENKLKKPRLKTKTKTLKYLKQLNISAVSLAHNHIYDNLLDGFNKTIDFLDSNNIRYLGAGLSKQEAEKPLIIEKGDEKICILSFVHEDTNPNLPEDCPIQLNIYKKDSILSKIKNFKKEGFLVILFLHWGGKFEGGMYPDRYQPQDAREYISNGADLIIGHHSHTLQPNERINGKYVFYSLGNFCFADIISDGKLKRILNHPRFIKSIMLEIEFNGKEYKINMVPFKNKKLNIVQVRKWGLLNFRLRGVIFQTLKNTELFWKMYEFKTQKLNPYINMVYTFNEISYIKKLRRLFKH